MSGFQLGVLALMFLALCSAECQSNQWRKLERDRMECAEDE